MPVQVLMRYRPVTDVRDTRLLSATRPIEALYREIGPKLWRSLFAYSGDREIASDALAEAFAQAIARGDGLRSPEPWIWTAAFRIAAGELARRKPNAVGSREPSYEMPGPADHLVSALKRLPANQRIAVVMHDYADRPTKEVAEALEISVATVHVHLSRGRRRLRHLSEQSYG
jgi:RNA polymerase sigma-70 factor, ECF subfamily